MDKHSCKTYFSVNFGFDKQKNIELLRNGNKCPAEELGITDKDEAERYIIDELGIAPAWERHRFVIGFNDEFMSDVNDMIRVTLKGLFGKEEKIKELQKRFAVTTVLEIVPYIAANSDEPFQRLSLDKDIIDFLSATGTEFDLDYYVV